MENMITEKTYPIQRRWLLKNIIQAALCSPVAFLVVLHYQNSPIALKSIVIVLCLVAGYFILAWLMDVLCRSAFHYTLEDTCIAVQQGPFLAKRDVSYRDIQRINVHQRLRDRILGLASITFNDSAHEGEEYMNDNGLMKFNRTGLEAFGFRGDKVHIPGLRKEDAELLKAAILQGVERSRINGHVLL